MDKSIKVMIEGHQGSGKTQIAEAMLSACDKLGKSAVLRDSGTIKFTKQGILDKNRGHGIEVEINTRQTA